MRRKKEIIFWGMVTFLVQIILVMVQTTQFATDEIYQPLKYLYGDGYGKAKLYNLEQYMWLLDLSLYCIMTVQKIAQCREEDSYMSILRYSSFRTYYFSAYRSFLVYTGVYQMTVFLGALAGYGIIQLWHEVEIICWYPLLLSQVCMLFGNLFFGVIMFYVILRWDALKGAILIYPGIPVLTLVLKGYLPRCVNNFIPGSWMMVARSREFVQGGFSVGIVLIMEGIVFIMVSCLAVRMRGNS